MNPVKTIGRYQLPILNVEAIQEKQFEGWRKLLLLLKLAKPGYVVTLKNGRTLHFTPEEKAAYDDALAFHAEVVRVWGMCKSAGLRG